MKGVILRPYSAPGSTVICFPLHLPLPKTKKNLTPLQVVKRKMKIIRTKGLEVCPKTPYLCTTPQGRNGCFERRNHEKKKGLRKFGRI